MQILNNEPSPKQIYQLSSGAYGLSVKRTGFNSIELAPMKGFLADDMDRVMRSDSFTFNIGETLFYDGLIVNILEINDLGRPKRVAFYFAVNLDSGKYLMWCWQGAGVDAALQDCNLPEIGQEIWLEPVSF